MYGTSIALAASLWLAVPPLTATPQEAPSSFAIVPGQPRANAPVVPNALSPSVRGLGTRLGARIRRDGADALQRFIARGLTRAAIEHAGGVVTSELGPIVSGQLSGRALYTLAPFAELIDAPQPLHLALDRSRKAINADAPDEGRDLPEKFRGKDVLIAVYDSGVDLSHPDLRELDGPSRVVAVWDQTRIGTPPAGFTVGHECTKQVLQTDACPTGDSIGHGTHVLSIAGSNSPSYRGIAPDAKLAVARSETFELFTDALTWFRTVADRERLPMVVNFSLSGHQGPHDGTSLEAQAIDAYPFLVVTAAGNEGTTPVHVELPAAATPRHAALRFPVLPQAVDQYAVVEIWCPGTTPPTARALIMDPRGALRASTDTITIGGMGRTEILAVNTTTVGTVLLDAEAGPNPLNGKSHLRMEVQLFDWRDAPAGTGVFVVEVSGNGACDLWVDSPAVQPAPVSFDVDGMVELDSLVLGDTDHTISDIATAVSAVAVSAFTTRTEFPMPDGSVGRVPGSVGAIAGFSAYGPTLDPTRTGDKPDLAAPGYIIVAARSRSVEGEDPGMVSPLYRANAGTSMASPHVAGAVALVLDAKPMATKFDLKQILLSSSKKEEGATDARWGAGKLDAAEAVALALGLDTGCGCTAAALPRSADPAASALIWLVFSLWLRGPRSRSRA